MYDPNEGEASRRGSTFKPGGQAGAPYPSVPPPMGAGPRGREAGGRI